jgi:organic radical activating enzyme
LVAVDIVDVFCAIAGEGGIAAGRLQLFVEQGILAGKIRR